MPTGGPTYKGSHGKPGLLTTQHFWHMWPVAAAAATASPFCAVFYNSYELRVVLNFRPEYQSRSSTPKPCQDGVQDPPSLCDPDPCGHASHPPTSPVFEVRSASVGNVPGPHPLRFSDGSSEVSSEERGRCQVPLTYWLYTWGVSPLFIKQQANSTRGHLWMDIGLLLVLPSTQLHMIGSKQLASR